MSARRHATVHLAAALLWLLGTGGAAVAQETPPSRLALVGGMLLDGYEAPPIHHAAILMEGDRITAVGPAKDVEIPPYTKVIDTRGMTMLPGLIDLHVHLMILGHGDYADWFPSFTPRMEDVMAVSRDSYCRPASRRPWILAGRWRSWEFATESTGARYPVPGCW